MAKLVVLRVQIKKATIARGVRSAFNKSKNSLINTKIHSQKKWLEIIQISMDIQYAVRHDNTSQIETVHSQERSHQQHLNFILFCVLWQKEQII